MWRLASIPFLIHALGMFIDEVWFHRRRGLPAWERWGHPLDTLTMLACYVLVLALPPTRNALLLYAGAALFSSLFITKDEWIHARHCGGGESWLHAFLFMLHPVLLAIAGVWRFAPLARGIPGNAGASAPVNAFGFGNADFLGSFHVTDDVSDPGRAFFALFLCLQTALTGAFLCYQLLYWNGPWKTSPAPA
jgi:hypothetical protein